MGPNGSIGRLTGRTGLALGLPYPEALGVWPAVVLLLAFSWTELVFPSPAVPANIAWLAIAYSLLTWSGMARVRPRDLDQARRGFLDSLRPIRPLRADRSRIHKQSGARGLALRPFGAGLLGKRPASAIDDGLRPARAVERSLRRPADHAGMGRSRAALIGLMPGLGEPGSVVVRTVGLVAFWVVFLAAYLAVSAIMSVAAGRRSPRDMAQSFALTLVPIAIGYHLAHYLVFLLIQGQYIMPLASDPFGCGWDLFGTAGYRVDIAIVGRALRLVHGGDVDRLGPHRRRLSRRMSRRTQVLGPARGAALAGAADRADGGLHLHQPLHSVRADRRAPRAGAADGGAAPRC